MAQTVIVIGAGPSGLMAAITAARAGAEVTVLEQNEKPGKKLLASGNGKCNLTNMRMDRTFYRGNDPDFIETVIRHFDQSETLEFFHSIGLLTIDRKGWVYPSTEQAGAVLNLLLILCSELHIKIKTNEHVQRIGKEPVGKGSCFTVKTDGWTYRSDALIVATGSPASAVKGSSDDVVGFADFFGIPHEEFLPALVPLKVVGNQPSKWAGTRVHASAALYVDGKAMVKDTGEIQLTENGISGIPVFQISRYAVRASEEGKRCEVELNFMPDMTDEKLADELMDRVRNCPYKTPAQLLIGLLPEKLIPIFSGVEAGDPANSLESMSASQIESWLTRKAYRIRHHKVQIKGASSLKQAQICSGGILTSALKESLESKKISGLFFCGEAVDCDGCCGGYNLQWAWSSGYTAGISAAYK